MASTTTTTTPQELPHPVITIEDVEDIHVDQQHEQQHEQQQRHPQNPVKHKSKLLRGLQRISSSPSLAQLGRRRAHSNPYSGRSTLSCVSLAGASPTRGPGTQSPFLRDAATAAAAAAGSFTTPTSAPDTPGGDAPWLDAPSMRNPIRRVEHAELTPRTASPTSPLPLDMRRPHSKSSGIPFPDHAEPSNGGDYFALPLPLPLRRVRRAPRRPNFDFWAEMPHEIKLAIFAYLKPKELVRASVVSTAFYKTCFDGQLWTCFDASEFYRDIPAESLAKIIVAAGPFVKDLNLRGCVQVEHYKRAEVVVTACKNLIHATLEGCRNFQRSTLHHLLRSNERLAHLNLTGLTAVTNGTCKVIAQCCPSLETFNVSWCTHMDARGIRTVLAGCPQLRDLRAGEVRGFHSVELAQEIFERNGLERLVLSGCADITDAALQTMIVGAAPEYDVLTNRPLVPARRLRHLDLSRCTRLTSAGVGALAHQVPLLEGLQLSGCTLLTDAALSALLPSAPALTHLDLDELSALTNALLADALAKAPSAPTLQHLSLSYCEAVGDVGVLPVLRACPALASLELDNTRISDLVLAEAAACLRARAARTPVPGSRPRVSLRMVVFDCQNVTWTGIREVLSRNSEIRRPPPLPNYHPPTTYPTEIIGLKCFYGWQMTVDEHTKRVLHGDLAGAVRLERKWTEWMMVSEEVGAGGAVGGRRRRRRAREVRAEHADEEEGGGGGGMGVGGGGGGGGGPRRRRARSGGCSVM